MSDYDPTLCGCGPQMPFGSGCMSQWRKPKPNGTCATCGGWLPGEKPPMSDSVPSRPQSYPRMRDALDMACGADFELASCARALEEAGRPDLSVEADSIFRAALNFRRKLEREIGDA